MSKIVSYIFACCYIDIICKKYNIIFIALEGIINPFYVDELHARTKIE